MKIKILTFCLFFLSLKGISQEFGGEILGGFNASQVDGDLYGGYNKGGLLLGGGVHLPLKDKWGFHIQGLYSQKGSASPSDATPYFKVRLNYIDMPLFIDWNFYNKIHANLGLVPGYNISAKADNGGGFQDIGDIDGEPFIKKFSLEYLIGAEFEFADNVYGGIRFTYSLISVSSTSPTWLNNNLSFYLKFNL